MESNYFPTVSHDGKWLVFCQASNFVMLHPDSRLFIVPLEGDNARDLQSNFKDMNSWHSWSPNGKWLVYVSKASDIYSDMFLTHIDEKGNASDPVLVENTKRFRWAANYPKFMNREPGFKFRMDYSFINIMDIEDAITANKKEKAKAMLDQYISQKLGTPLEYHEVDGLAKELTVKQSIFFAASTLPEYLQNKQKLFSYANIFFSRVTAHIHHISGERPQKLDGTSDGDDDR